MNKYYCSRCNEKFQSQISCDNPYCPVCGKDDETAKDED